MKWGLILGALAAIVLYKYSQMDEEQKRNMTNNLKAKGKKLYDEYVPDSVKDTLAKS